MLEVINVSKNYGKKEVLKNISFNVYEGEIVSLIGDNGSGKTTTFKIISQLIQQDEGEIYYQDDYLKKDQLAYLSEERSLYQDVTVYQQLYLIGRLNNILKERLDRIIKQYLQQFNLSEYINKQIRQLSKGNQQKVSLIACLIKQPEVLILDEPFTGLDLNNIEIFKKWILRYKEEKRIVILSSHIYEPINEIADRFLYLKNGIIEINVSQKELQEDERRVVETDCDLLFDDIEIIKEIEKENKVKYILNKKNAASLTRKLLKQGCSVTNRPLNIEELIQL